FIVYSPLLFLALAWGVIASWRRINQQFKVLFLMWFGLPVFAFYLLLSVNKSAAPNWDALAFFGFGLVATYFWCERLQASVLTFMRQHRRACGVNHESGRIGHGFAARCRLSTTAERSE